MRRMNHEPCLVAYGETNEDGILVLADGSKSLVLQDGVYCVEVIYNDEMCQNVILLNKKRIYDNTKLTMHIKGEDIGLDHIYITVNDDKKTIEIEAVAYDFNPLAEAIINIYKM